MNSILLPVSREGHKLFFAVHTASKSLSLISVNLATLPGAWVDDKGADTATEARRRIQKQHRAIFDQAGYGRRIDQRYRSVRYLYLSEAQTQALYLQHLHMCHGKLRPHGCMVVYVGLGQSASQTCLQLQCWVTYGVCQHVFQALPHRLRL